jgi:hypothetical protein
MYQCTIPPGAHHQMVFHFNVQAEMLPKQYWRALVG